MKDHPPFIIEEHNQIDSALLDVTTVTSLAATIARVIKQKIEQGEYIVVEGMVRKANP